jgi:predicted permease
VAAERNFLIRGVVKALLTLAPASLDHVQRRDVLGVVAERGRGVRGLRRVGHGAREVLGAAWLVVGLWADEMLDTNRREGRGHMVDTIRQDTRFALRTLTRNPGYATSAIVVLALGIGACTAIFSAVNAYFFQPLPFADEDRLVTIYETNPEFGWEDATAAPANLLDWRDQVDALADVTGYAEYTDRVTALREGEPVLIGGNAVMGNFFQTLGVPPALGRTFRMEETWADGDDAGSQRNASDDVVVISHAFWTSHFGADPDAVGRRLELTSSSPVVIGVMPAGFRFPSEEVDVWYPYGWTTSAREDASFRRAHFVRAVARLAPGYDRTEAGAQLQVVVERLQAEYPETNSVMGAGLAPMRDFLIRGVRTQLLVLLGAVGVLLLLACTNVATLMLVRANDRSREVGLRRALGAQPGRLARQMLTESGVIAAAGALAGLGLGWVGVRVLTATDPLGIDGATSLALDYRVVLFTVGIAALSGLLFGTAPALRATRGDIESTLREGARGSEGRHGLRTVGALVTAEVALALLLVVGAGLMVRTYVLLRDVDPGFETEGIVAVQFTIPSTRYPNRDQVLGFYDRFLEAVEARPGITKAGVVGLLPLSGSSWSSQFQAEGWPPERVGFEIFHRRADAGYFEAVGTPLVRGRMFGPGDGSESPRVVVINETFAREHFPGEDPIGQRIAYDRAATEESTWYEIIGIVGDQHQRSPAVPPRAEVFENRNQDWGRSNWVVVRGEGEAADPVPTVRAVLQEMDPMIPVARTETLRDVWGRSMEREAFILRLLGVFGAVALLLASVGVYGVTAQAARRRTQEIGIRMALGAAAPDVLRLMLRRGAAIVGLGVVLGLGASLVATRALSTFLFGVEPTDPATLGTVALGLAGIALFACWLPARRATRVDPVRSLRAE